jgi:hypothetical protein
MGTRGADVMTESDFTRGWLPRGAVAVPSPLEPRAIVSGSSAGR